MYVDGKGDPYFKNRSKKVSDGGSTALLTTYIVYAAYTAYTAEANHTIYFASEKNAIMP